eukprot:4284794-Pyramimonas_sp.AAC.1
MAISVCSCEHQRSTRGRVERTRPLQRDPYQLEQGLNDAMLELLPFGWNSITVSRICVNIYELDMVILQHYNSLA